MKTNMPSGKMGGAPRGMGGAPRGMGGAPRGAGGMGGKINGKIVKRLLSLIFAEHKIKFVVVVICILTSTLSGVAGSLFLQILIDDYIAPLVKEAASLPAGQLPDFSGLLFAVIVMACIYAVGVVTAYLYNRIMVVIAQNVLRDVRDEMFAKMQALPIKYFDTHTNGDIMSHYTNDTDTLRQMISQSLPQMFSSVMTILAVFVAMLLTSIWLTLFVLVFLVIMMMIVKKVGGNSGKYFVRQQKSLGDTNGYIEEMINGQKVIKVFNHEQATMDGFDKLNDELCDNATQANKFANILMPIMMNLGHLQYALLAVIGGAFAILGLTNFTLTGFSAFTLGGIVSFLQLSKSFNNPIGQVSQQINMVIMALAGAERIFNLMDEPAEVDNGYVTLVNVKRNLNGELEETTERTGLWAWKHPHNTDGTVTYTELKGNVKLNEVDFGYSEDKLVLHDISLFAEPGQKVAFVGATGAGKTTITNLINRFYDIADGKIHYDGININKIKKADLRRSLGIVLQDVNLFTGTVMENIRYGKLDATDEEVISAAKRANAHGFISMLPQGYDTLLEGDGSGLSQGQRQLISIARAAVADPPVMILDEATSSIDTRTEAIVQKGMDALMHGRTVFVIAHRLSTVQNSDVIMVLEMGRIIERGSHANLIAEKGKYYQLYTGAFELE